jgi:hypothetical protein
VTIGDIDARDRDILVDSRAAKRADDAKFACDARAFERK